MEVIRGHFELKLGTFLCLVGVGGESSEEKLAWEMGRKWRRERNDGSAGCALTLNLFDFFWVRGFVGWCAVAIKRKAWQLFLCSLFYLSWCLKVDETKAAWQNTTTNGRFCLASIELVWRCIMSLVVLSLSVASLYFILCHLSLSVVSLCSYCVMSQLKFLTSKTTNQLSHRVTS